MELEKLKVRPTQTERQAILDCDSVMLTIQESLFGIDYIKSIRPI